MVRFYCKGKCHASTWQICCLHDCMCFCSCTNTPDMVENVQSKCMLKALMILVHRLFGLSKQFHCQGFSSFRRDQEVLGGLVGRKDHLVGQQSLARRVGCRFWNKERLLPLEMVACNFRPKCLASSHFQQERVHTIHGQLHGPKAQVLNDVKRLCIPQVQCIGFLKRHDVHDTFSKNLIPLHQEVKVPWLALQSQNG